MIHVWRRDEPKKLQHSKTGKLSQEQVQMSEPGHIGAETPQPRAHLSNRSSPCLLPSCGINGPRQSHQINEGSPDDAFAQALDAFCEHDHVLPSAAKDCAMV